MRLHATTSPARNFLGPIHAWLWLRDAGPDEPGPGRTLCNLESEPQWADTTSTPITCDPCRRRLRESYEVARRGYEATVPPVTPAAYHVPEAPALGGLTVEEAAAGMAEAQRLAGGVTTEEALRAGAHPCRCADRPPRHCLGYALGCKCAPCGRGEAAAEEESAPGAGWHAHVRDVRHIDAASALARLDRLEARAEAAAKVQASHSSNTRHPGANQLAEIYGRLTELERLADQGHVAWESHNAAIEELRAAQEDAPVSQDRGLTGIVMRYSQRQEAMEGRARRIEDRLAGVEDRLADLEDSRMSPRGSLEDRVATLENNRAALEAKAEALHARLVALADPPA